MRAAWGAGSVLAIIGGACNLAALGQPPHGFGIVGMVYSLVGIVGGLVSLAIAVADYEI